MLTPDRGSELDHDSLVTAILLRAVRGAFRTGIAILSGMSMGEMTVRLHRALIYINVQDPSAALIIGNRPDARDGRAWSCEAKQPGETYLGIALRPSEQYAIAMSVIRIFLKRQHPSISQGLFRNSPRRTISPCTAYCHQIVNVIRQLRDASLHAMSHLTKTGVTI
jgi:hypothetical protein